MPSRQKADQNSRWPHTIVVALFLLFLLAGLYTMTTMLGELKEIASGQQELIINLLQMETFQQKPTAPAVRINRDLNVEMVRIENETNRRLAQLQKEVEQLKKEVDTLKRRP
jgi:uncharacterized protein YlxW (UPF0749 family)